MNYREVLEESKNCPNCCSKTLNRFLKSKNKLTSEVAKESIDNQKVNTSKLSNPPKN